LCKLPKDRGYSSVVNSDSRVHAVMGHMVIGWLVAKHVGMRNVLPVKSRRPNEI
jgi:hypothetical protein